MHPVLFQLFGTPVSSYGFFVGLGLAVSGLLALAWGPFWGLPRTTAAWVLPGAAFFGLIGARLLYALVHPGDFLEDPVSTLRPGGGGFVIYGALVGGALFLTLASRLEGAPWRPRMDLIVTVLFAGIFIGRWGCFLVGCCHGRIAPDWLPWAVHHPPHEASFILPELWYRPLHPVQLYLSLNGLVLFLLCLRWLGKGLPPGRTALRGLMLYALTRGVLEFFRGDDAMRGFLGPLSTSQWIGLAMLVILPSILPGRFPRRTWKAPDHAIAELRKPRKKPSAVIFRGR